MTIQSSDNGVYSRFLGKALSARCQELAKHEAAATLKSELAVARALVVDALDMYEESVALAIEAGATGLALIGVKLKAGAVVTQAIGIVKDMALAQQRLIGNAGLDMVAMQVVISQVVQYVDSELQQVAPALEQSGISSRDLMARLSNRLRDEVKLPQGYDGTSIEPGDEEFTADDEALAMDATVPFYKETSA
jgi:hypothetical protein